MENLSPHQTQDLLRNGNFFAESFPRHFLHHFLLQMMNLTKASTSKTQNPTNEKQSELLPPCFFDQQAQPLGLDEIFPKSSQRDDITANNSTTKISFSKAKAFLVKTRELGSTEDGFSWKSCSKWPMNQNHLNKIFLHTRPKICYAMENLLLHHSISSRHLSKFRPVEISMYMS